MNKTERDAFILENMGLVRMVANRYSGLVKNNPALDMDDLISAGTIGLIKACDDFDPSFGTKLIFRTSKKQPRAGYGRFDKCRDNRAD